MKGKQQIFNPAIIRSPWSEFYGAEIEDSLKTHPDSYLQEISREGFNGVWLHCLLRDVVVSPEFSEFGAKSREQIYALNKLVEKTSRYGLKVFLYLCEPRGFKEGDEFWEKNPDVKGQPVTFGRTEGLFANKYFAMCTSSQRVKDFLYGSSYELFKKVPGLGGVFMITASEFHTHCYSHHPIKQKTFTVPDIAEWAKQPFVCKRCELRRPYEVAAEVISLVNKGVKEANSSAEVIAWNWSWYILEADPQKKLIGLLPEDVIIQADFERGGSKNILNKRIAVDEYSFAYTGPSPRFKNVCSFAKSRGMKVTAKLQIGTTHELVTVPYIPVPYIIAEKLYRMRKMGVNGYLGCWIFGGNVSLMSKVAGRMSIYPELTPAAAVREIAVEEFGKEDSKYVTKAWRQFSNAWTNYPFSVPFLYNSPINYATAYPFSLSSKKHGPIASWLPLPKDKDGHMKVGDNLETWIEPFAPDFVISVLEKLLSGWNQGCEVLEANKKGRSARYIKELQLAEHIKYLVESTINIVGFYKLLRDYNGDKDNPVIKDKLRKLLLKERSVVQKDVAIIGANREFGYHAEAHDYFITTKDLEHKLALLNRDIDYLK